MRLIQRQSILAAALAIIAAACQTANAQFAPGGSSGKRATSPASEVKFITKVYRVDDLILPSPNYPFRGTWLPGMTDERSQPAGGGAGRAHFRVLPDRGKQGAGMMGGMGATMMGGGMPGMMPGGGMGTPSNEGASGGEGDSGGGYASAGMAGETTAPRGGNSFTLSAEDLMEAIATFIEPESWSRNVQGGGAEIGQLGHSLVVRQSADAHKQIEDFLEALRAENGATQTVTVEAVWLQLDSEQLAKLKAAIAEGSAAGGEIPDGPYRGQVTCFNGQTVHIVSGRLQTVLQGGIPIVSGGGAVGYQPTMITPHVGAMLEITPTLLPGGKAAIVNVQSSVTRWDRPGPAAEFGGPGIGSTSEGQSDSMEKPAAAPGGAGNGGPGGMMMNMMAGMAGGPGNVSQPVQVDRINVVAQQLATSLRVPLAKPVLVGGMTFPGAEGTQAADSQLYLVIKISVVE